MTVIETILNLIDARAYFHGSCSVGAIDDWPDERPLAEARHELLKALSHEIRASLANTTRDNRPTNSTCGTKWAVGMEMGGQMCATIFDDKTTAIEAVERFCRNYQIADYLDTEVDSYGIYTDDHARCYVEQINLPPRKTALVGGMDARFVLIEMADGTLHLSFVETREELQAAIADFEERSLWKQDEPFYTWHVILVP